MNSEIYHGEFQSREDVFRHFEEKDEGGAILFAAYDVPCYEGYAFVLVERGGELYEINGQHCSCMGLEGQWHEEETTVEALAYRSCHGHIWGIGGDRSALRELQGILLERWVGGPK